MATFKAVVDKTRERKDGTFNIKIRVTHNRKIKYIPTTYYVTRDDLKRKTLELKNQYYIDETEDIIRKYRKICNGVGEALEFMTVDQIAELIKEDKKGGFELDIVKYGRDLADKMEANGHVGTASVYRTALNSLCKFAKRDTISFREITVRFLTDWIDWIGAQPSLGERKKGTRAQSLYLCQLRTIYNRAKLEFNDEDLGIIRIPYSPFKKVVIPKEAPPRKRALTVEQLKALASVPYTKAMQQGTNRSNFAKDMFILSFGLIGMNAVDLYNCTDYSNGRITYQRTKTKNRRADKAEISIRVEPEIMPLLEKYRDETGERVFRFYRMYSTVNTLTAAVNKGLKAIGNKIGVDDLEFYAARHTWATLAANKAKIDKYTVHAALNHVDEQMKVTDIYIAKSYDAIDEANRTLLDYLKLDLGDFTETKQRQ